MPPRPFVFGPTVTTKQTAAPLLLPTPAVTHAGDSSSNNKKSASLSRREDQAPIQALGKATVRAVKQLGLPAATHRCLYGLYRGQVNALWFEDLSAESGIEVEAAFALVKAMHEDLGLEFDEALCVGMAVQ